jgi:hypothetical protein
MTDQAPTPVEMDYDGDRTYEDSLADSITEMAIEDPQIVASCGFEQLVTPKPLKRTMAVADFEQWGIVTK